MDSKTRNGKISYVGKTFGVLPVWTISQVSTFSTHFEEKKKPKILYFPLLIFVDLVDSHPSTKIPKILFESAI